MKNRHSLHRLLLENGIRAAIKAADTIRRATPVVLLCVAMLSLGAVYLATTTLADSGLWKNWTRVFGHTAPRLGTNFSTPARTQTSGNSNSAYTLTAFDAPGAGTGELEGTVALEINASGEITGVYSNAIGVVHGFIRAADGAFTTFDAPDAGSTPPGIEGTIPIAIDTAGDVVGTYIDSNHAYHGFVRLASDGTITEFDATGAPTTVANRGTTVTGINDAGQVVGLYTTGSYDTSSTYYGFVRSADGAFTTLTEPDAGSSENANGNKQGTAAMAINASGEIAGFYIDSSNNQHGFVLSASGVYTSFDPPGSTSSGKNNVVSGTTPLSIDAAGDVTGFYTDTNLVRHGFVRTAAGVITSFDAPGAAANTGIVTGTAPFSIDPGGNYISGIYTDATGLGHGFVYSQPLTGAGTFTTFDAPGAALISGAPLSGTSGFSVNSSGMLSGEYSDSSGVLHGLLLSLAPIAPALTSPAPGSTLSSGSITFQWTPGTVGATAYQLRIGTEGVGADNLYFSGTVTGTQVTAPNIPAYGVTVYVRLYYYAGGTWTPIDYTYTESGSPTPPSLISPAPGSTLTSATGNTFCWNPGDGPALFVLYLGTTVGASDVYSSPSATAATCVGNITVPANAQTLYASLNYELSGRWYSVRSTYVDPGTPEPPSLTTPTPDSTLGTTNIAFTWNPGLGNDSYQLILGTWGPGASDLYASGETTATQVTVPSIPPYGVIVYATLYYRHLGVWTGLNYTYMESGSSTPPSFTSPTPGSTLTSAINNFCWNPGHGPALFQLHLGTTKGGSDVYNATTLTPATCVNNITVPTNGAPLYATLDYALSGRYYHISATYTEP